MFVITSAWFVVTAPNVTDSFVNGLFVLASMKVSNSAAVSVIEEIPLSAILSPLAKTLALLVVTAPMVIESALKASSTGPDTDAASASVIVMETI